MGHRFFFCVALHIVIALLTVAIALVFALSILKAIAKSKRNIFAIFAKGKLNITHVRVKKSNNYSYRYHDIWKSNTEKKPLIKVQKLYRNLTVQQKLFQETITYR